MIPALRTRLSELAGAWRVVRRDHPRALRVTAGVAASILIALPILGLLFVLSLRATLPDRDALRRIGEMDRACWWNTSSMSGYPP